MSTNRTLAACEPGEVWQVLSDGWLYPLFVVGATRMREVDEGWPRETTRLHHSVGSWPVLLDDTTESLECVPSTRLRLKARAWPSGAAEVLFTITPHHEGTEITLEEDAVSGPGTLVPPPVRQPLLHWRNTETLRRLRLLAERRAAG